MDIYYLATLRATNPRILSSNYKFGWRIITQKNEVASLEQSTITTTIITITTIMPTTTTTTIWD